jgi:hypothetical protein
MHRADDDETVRATSGVPVNAETPLNRAKAEKSFMTDLMVTD